MCVVKMLFEKNHLIVLTFYHVLHDMIWYDTIKLINLIVILDNP